MNYLRPKICFFCLYFLASPVSAHLGQISGKTIGTVQEIQRSASKEDVLVVLFLSSVCPCSDSHVKEVSKLAHQYPNFNFVGVHSNVDEDLANAKTYFKGLKLPFPVIQDQGAKLADRYKALKTPHAFVVNSKGEILYQGGVSDSSDFDRAKTKHLREALSDIKEGKKVRTPAGRPLGCIISRG